MTILVTGAAGFIGNALCKSLLDQGHEVVGVDNLNDYYSIELKAARLTTLANYKNFTFEKIDLADAVETKKLFTNKRYSYVYHMAAQAGVRLKREELDRYISSNVVAFTNILANSVSAEVPNFLYASSSSVYGDIEGPSLSESNPQNFPTSYYGATKLFNEHASRVLSKGSSTKSRGLRFFTVYGPMGRPDMAYFRIISSLLNSKSFRLFGDGTLKRDFTYIDDVISSVIRLADQLDKIEFQYSDVVNVGGGQPQSIRELIEISERLSGAKLQIIEEKPDSSDVKSTNADTYLIENLIGFKPSISIEVGIANFIEWANSESIKGKLNGWIESTK